MQILLEIFDGTDGLYLKSVEQNKDGLNPGVAATIHHQDFSHEIPPSR
jgi:hypothetical protein